MSTSGAFKALVVSCAALLARVLRGLRVLRAAIRFYGLYIYFGGKGLALTLLRLALRTFILAIKKAARGVGRPWRSLLNCKAI